MLLVCGVCKSEPRQSPHLKAPAAPCPAALSTKQRVAAEPQLHQAREVIEGVHIRPAADATIPQQQGLEVAERCLTTITLLLMLLPLLLLRM